MTNHFEADYQKLALMIGYDSMCDAFITEYKRLLTENYNEMHRVRNTDKLLAGEYTARGKLLESLLHQQILSLGGTPPIPRRKANDTRKA